MTDVAFLYIAVLPATVDRLGDNKDQVCTVVSEEIATWEGSLSSPRANAVTGEPVDVHHIGVQCAGKNLGACVVCGNNLLHCCERHTSVFEVYRDLRVCLNPRRSHEKIKGLRVRVGSAV